MAIDSLLEAVKQGDRAAVRAVLDQNPSLLSAHDAQGNSATLLAVYYAQKDILHDLLARHPELNVFEAAATGDSERVRQEVTRDASLAQAYSSDGYTALGLASFFGHLESATFLLGRGAQVNDASHNEMAVRPLHSAAAGRHQSVAEVLIAHGAEVNATSHGGWTALHSAADHGQIEMVRLLVEHGAKADVANDEGVTPVDLARRGSHTEVADLLARRGG